MEKSDGKLRSYLGTPSPNFLLKEFNRKDFLIVILLPWIPQNIIKQLSQSLPDQSASC
jgi:hypothetical protein